MILANSVKKVPTASGDYLVRKITHPHNSVQHIYEAGAEMGLVLLVPGTTNNSVNVIQNGLKIIH